MLPVPDLPHGGVDRAGSDPERGVDHPGAQAMNRSPSMNALLMMAATLSVGATMPGERLSRSGGNTADPQTKEAAQANLEAARAKRARKAAKRLRDTTKA